MNKMLSGPRSGLNAMKKKKFVATTANSKLCPKMWPISSTVMAVINVGFSTYVNYILYYFFGACDSVDD
jgi:hypothetical protein